MTEASHAVRNDDDLHQRVLVLAPIGRDAELARRVLAEVGVRANTCATSHELCEELRRGAGVVLLTDECLTDSALSALAACVREQPPWSDIPFVVLATPGGGPRLEQRALKRVSPLGNVSLLERPVRVMILMSAIETALRARRRQLEVRALLAELELAVHQRDQFLAMLGHELRNPIAALGYALELLGRAPPGGEASARQQSAIKRHVNHLGRLVDDLLDVARVTAGKIVIERKRVDIGELVRRCASSVEPAMRAQRLAVSTTIPPAPLVISGDPVRLEQVLVNLLTNAMKYTPSGGHVVILVEREGDEAVIRIEDDGIGIPTGMLSRIFDLFTQVDEALDRSRGGMGIGLTLVRRLVQLHDGTVSAESGHGRRGTRLIVRLPIDPAAVDETPLLAAVDDTAATEPRHVLLIEDNADIRESMQELLKSYGHRVEVAEDGPSGVEVALASRPEFALVDIGLPGMNGYEVARAIRASLGKAVILAALTGYGQPGDRNRALEAGFDVHLTKPVSLEQMNELLVRSPAREAATRATGASGVAV
jgi:signal transduction histidine kinase/CheY-like chemotaxis protein